MIFNNRDILFPLNLLGANQECVVYDFTGTYPPTTGSIPNRKFVFTIVWTGKGLRMCYTRVNRSGGNVHPKYDYVQVRENYANGSGTTETVLTPDGTILAGVGSYVQDNKLYFKCTNVTSLIVNGQQII